MYPRWFSAVACKAKQKENWFPQHPRLYFRMSGLSSRVPHSVKTRIPIAKYFYLLRTSKAFPDWFRKSTCPFPNKKSQIGNKGFSTMVETCRSRPSSSLYFLLFWRVHQLCGPSKRRCCDQGPDDTLKVGGSPSGSQSVILQSAVDRCRQAMTGFLFACLFFQSM
jgi:hypothetical protein